MARAVTCTTHGTCRYMNYTWHLQVHVLHMAPAGTCTIHGTCRYMYYIWHVQVHVLHMAHAGTRTAHGTCRYMYYTWHMQVHVLYMARAHSLTGPRSMNSSTGGADSIRNTCSTGGSGSTHVAHVAHAVHRPAHLLIQVNEQQACLCLPEVQHGVVVEQGLPGVGEAGVGGQGDRLHEVELVG